MGLFKHCDHSLPIWFMRQAGRYHSHYQKLKSRYSFETLCKTPDLACEVTLGPVEEFQFDAAILFSDILFPLERLGFGLSFNPGPILQKKISTANDVRELFPISTPQEFYQFQKDALDLIRPRLKPDISLLGFVGAPFTLYTYACEGGHSGNILKAKLGLYNGCFESFSEIIFNELLNNMSIQASSPIDAICLFDTAAGELSSLDFERFVLPLNRRLTQAFKNKFPHIKIIYYSKNTNLDYLKMIQDKNIDVLGIDWRINLATALNELGNQYLIQGNIDPAWLLLPSDRLITNLSLYCEDIRQKSKKLNRWIFGLGHGVLKETPEQNVSLVRDYVKNNFKLV